MEGVSPLQVALALACRMWALREHCLQHKDLIAHHEQGTRRSFLPHQSPLYLANKNLVLSAHLASVERGQIASFVGVPVLFDHTSGPLIPVSLPGAETLATVRFGLWVNRASRPQVVLPSL